MTKICEWCTKEYTTRREEQRCCSRSCSSFAVNDRPEVVAKKTTRITKICLECGAEYIVKKSKAERSKCCSRLCMNRYLAKKKITPMHTCPQCDIEFKPARKGQICCSVECHIKRKDFPNNREKICQKCGTGFYSAKLGQKYCTLRCYMLDRMADPAERKKVSIRSSKLMTQVYLDNNGANPYKSRHVTGFYFSTKNQESFWHDSSYELRAFKLLDKLPTVKSYNRCVFYIEYSLGNTQHNYFPDIHVTYKNGHEEIVEIKPVRRLKDEINIAKFKAANKYYKDSPIRYVVWTEKKLKKLEEEMT